MVKPTFFFVALLLGTLIGGGIGAGACYEIAAAPRQQRIEELESENKKQAAQLVAERMRREAALWAMEGVRVAMALARLTDEQNKQLDPKLTAVESALDVAWPNSKR